MADVRKSAAEATVLEMEKRYAEEDWMDVYIPKDERNDNDGTQYVTVTLSGKTYTIRRGEGVRVPVPVYQVLLDSGRFETIR